MKKISLIFACVTCFASLQAQKLSYNETQDIAVTQTIANEADFQSYTAQDGSTISIGDKLEVGHPSTNNGSFTHLYLGKFNLGNAMLAGVNYAPGALAGEVVIVDRIYVHHTKLSKKSPLAVMMYVRNPDRPKIACLRTILDFEMSMKVGEMINPNAAITRDQAVAKLKESKELLDLQVITQAKYDSIKNALIPIISKN